MFETKIINAISEISDNFDSFIIDLWGVLHDGMKAYPNALEAIKFLKAQKKNVILLSNAPRRAIKAKEKLDDLGFTEDLYDAVITSGEVTYQFVKNSPDLGNKYIYIGPPKDRDLLTGSKKFEVKDANQADFAVATGFDGFGSVFMEKQPQLDKALAANIKLLCANPDRKVINQQGEEQICAGLMGEYYEKKGGEVEYFGKPYPKCYNMCIEYWQAKNVNIGNICCIGDSFHTDIEGGNRIGGKTLLISGGIYKDDIEDKNRNINLENVTRILENKYQKPNFILNEFKN